MLRPPVAAFAAAFTAAALVSACGPARHQALPRPASTAAKADETQAAQILNQCMPKNILDLTGKPGRDAFGRCLEIPPAKRPAFSACLTTAAEADHLVSRAGRSEFTEVSVPKCAEANR